MGDAPVVAHSQLRFDPHEAGLVLKSPSIHDDERFSQKGVGGPEMKMGVVIHKFPDRFIANLLNGHCGIVIVGGSASGRVGILPGRVCVNGRKLTSGIDQFAQVAHDRRWSIFANLFRVVGRFVHVPVKSVR